MSAKRKGRGRGQEHFVTSPAEMDSNGTIWYTPTCSCGANLGGSTDDLVEALAAMAEHEDSTAATDN